MIKNRGSACYLTASCYCIFCAPSVHRLKDLKELLMVKNVPQDLYSLEGGLPGESYCIEKTEDKWHLYYSERGVK